MKPSHLFFAVLFVLSVTMGVSIVFIPWLVVDYLRLSSFWVGIVQAAVLLPSLLFLVVGGLNADRGVVLKKMLLLLLLYCVVHGGLWVAFGQWSLSLAVLLAYSVLLGVVGAFMQPCKDYLTGLFSVTGRGLSQSTIAQGALVQYMGQLAGVALFPWLYDGNIQVVPAAQVGLLLCGVLGLVVLQRSSLVDAGLTGDSTAGGNSVRNPLPDKQVPCKQQPFSFALLLSGFTYCWQSPVLRALVLIVAFNGFFHIGIFLVVLPILAHDIYVGDFALYSMLQGIFVLGIVASLLLIIYRGQLDGPGRRFVFDLLYAGLILIGLSVGPTYHGLLFLIFLWGVVVGISTAMGRSVLHAYVAADFRGRVVSVYQLALFGCAPLGALVAGVVIECWGVLALLQYSGVVSLLAFVATFFTKSLWVIESEDLCTVVDSQKRSEGE